MGILEAIAIAAMIAVGAGTGAALTSDNAATASMTQQPHVVAQPMVAQADREDGNGPAMLNL